MNVTLVTERFIWKKTKHLFSIATDLYPVKSHLYHVFIKSTSLKELINNDYLQDFIETMSIVSVSTYSIEFVMH